MFRSSNNFWRYVIIVEVFDYKLYLFIFDRFIKLKYNLYKKLK